MTRLPPKRTALFEIGVEELPARFVEPALAALSQQLGDRLVQAGVPYGRIDAWATPRRLAVVIHDLPPRSADQTLTAIGPPPKAAKDAEGHWTAAALGFAKAQKVPVSRLEARDTAKGLRLVVDHHRRGSAVDLLLKEILPSAVAALSFPKSMRWEPSGFRFARPLRWMVALVNSKVVRFQVAGVRSDRTTVGLLSLGGRKISIGGPAGYAAALRSRCILVDPQERRQRILSQIETIEKRIKGRAVVDAEHLMEVVYLTEYPTALAGRFDNAFLALPREVLTTVLRRHQKFFPVENAAGELMSVFIGVRNGPSDHQENVQEGYERVARARLADATFFFEQDRAVPLETFAGRLGEVGFHPDVGTLADKADRVRALVSRLGDKVGLDPAVINRADRVALLSKADLLTNTVRELPELQGVAGRFLAQSQDEDPKVALGIEQHYWPLTADGTLPVLEEAAIVALADKIDNLAANFFIGNLPSGSADPYGLRRMAAGVIRILDERRWHVPLRQLIGLAFDLAPWDGARKRERAESLDDFLKQRLAAFFGVQGFRPDDVDAVLSADGGSVATHKARLTALQSVRRRAEFDDLTVAVKRARNLLRQAKEKGIEWDDPDGLEVEQIPEGAERALFAAISEVRPVFRSAVERRDFDEALGLLVSLKAPIDTFFTAVMVMAEDPAQRARRLALLDAAKILFDAVADFSRLLPTAPASE